MSEDLTALAQDVRRSAQLVRDLKTESESITQRLVEIHGSANSTEQGQLHFAEMALEDARKRLEGVGDEPVTEAQRDRYNEAEKTSLEKELDHAIHPAPTVEVDSIFDEASVAGNHNGASHLTSDY